MHSTKSQERMLLWSDEFDRPAGAPPDERWWACETGDHGWGNDELQTYTSDVANAQHDGRGNLVVRATREGRGFHSARLVTRERFAFRYGRVEVRARLPHGQGLWPAIWMLGQSIGEIGWPECGEIDVMENLGFEETSVFGTVHCPGHSGAGGLSGRGEAASSLHRDFHLFALEWGPDAIGWSLDGIEYFSVRREQLGSAWVFDQPFYLLLNLAVGGTLGGKVGAQTVFPAEMTIDFVRVYQ